MRLSRIFFLGTFMVLGMVGGAQDKIDYSRQENWASLPEKDDNADQLPGKNGVDRQEDYPVDVFFLYPTSFTGQVKNNQWNAPIDDVAINAETANKSIKFQASIYNKVGKIYAPLYRQANIAVFFMDDKAFAAKVLDFAYQDVRDAFRFYIEHYNHNRPFIIASHSQGTAHAKRLIREEIEGTALAERMVVAYLVGMPVDTGYLSFPPCTSPEEIGCICSWRTFIHDYTPEYIAKENPAIVTNPITWINDSEYSDRKKHKGSVLLDFDKGVQPNIVSARRSGNILWIKKPRIKGRLFLRIKNYHIGDFNLFYQDVQENAILRRDAFLARLR